MSTIEQKMFCADFVLREDLSSENIKCFTKKDFLNEKGHYALHIELSSSDNLTEIIRNFRDLLTLEFKNLGFVHKWFGFITVYIFISISTSEDIEALKDEAYRFMKLPTNSGLGYTVSIFKPVKRLIFEYIVFTNNETFEEVKFSYFRSRHVNQILGKLKNESI